MTKWKERAQVLFKPDGMQQLENSNVLVVGLGGVGSFAAEFLARAGVGKMTIVDGDVVDITNINRQLPALHSTVGQSKAALMQARLLDINPELQLTTVAAFLSPEAAYNIVSSDFDCVLDCIDSITPKLHIIASAKRQKIKIISCMGAGGKTLAAKVKVADISNTENCHLARTIKKRLKTEFKIDKGVKAVFSSEIQDPDSLVRTDGSNFKKSFYGTSSYIPGLFGLYAAETAIRFLLDRKKPSED